MLKNVQFIAFLLIFSFLQVREGGDGMVCAEESPTTYKVEVEGGGNQWRSVCKENLADSISEHAGASCVRACANNNNDTTYEILPIVSMEEAKSASMFSSPIALLLGVAIVVIVVMVVVMVRMRKKNREKEEIVGLMEESAEVEESAETEEIVEQGEKEIAAATADVTPRVEKSDELELEEEQPAEQREEALEQDIAQDIEQEAPRQDDDKNDLKASEAEGDMNELSTRFLDKINSLIDENLGDSDFGVEKLAEMMGVSRSLLHLRMKSLTNTSMGMYLRNRRLNKAKSLLAQGYNVSETAYKTGFSDPNHFSKIFKKYMGMGPKEFVRNGGK